MDGRSIGPNAGWSVSFRDMDDQSRQGCRRTRFLFIGMYADLFSKEMEDRKDLDSGMVGHHVGIV